LSPSFKPSPQAPLFLDLFPETRLQFPLIALQSHFSFYRPIPPIRYVCLCPRPLVRAPFLSKTALLSSNLLCLYLETPRRFMTASFHQPFPGIAEMIPKTNSLHKETHERSSFTPQFSHAGAVQATLVRSPPSSQQIQPPFFFPGSLTLPLSVLLSKTSRLSEIFSSLYTFLKHQFSPLCLMKALNPFGFATVFQAVV